MPGEKLHLDVEGDAQSYGEQFTDEKMKNNPPEQASEEQADPTRMDVAESHGDSKPVSIENIEHNEEQAEDEAIQMPVDTAFHKEDAAPVTAESEKTQQIKDKIKKHPVFESLAKRKRKVACMAAAVALAAGLGIGASALMTTQTANAELPSQKIEQKATQGEMKQLPNGLKYNYDKDYNRTAEKESLYSFGVDKSDCYESKDKSIESIIETCSNQPETLASHVTSFPSVLREAGVDTNISAIDLDRVLGEDAKGGEIQSKLLDASQKMLKDPNTKFHFYRENKSEPTFYMYGDSSTPTGLHLAWSYSPRHDAPQVNISTGGGSESIDLNMHCGWQPNGEQFQGVPQLQVYESGGEWHYVPPTPPPERQWGKSGDPHTGPYNFDNSTDMSQPQNQDISHRNDGNQGYTPGSSTNARDQQGNAAQQQAQQQGTSHSDAEQEKRVAEGRF